MSPVKKILPRSFPTLIGLLVFACALGITTACSDRPFEDCQQARGGYPQIKTLLNEGDGYTAERILQGNQLDSCRGRGGRLQLEVL